MDITKNQQNGRKNSVDGFKLQYKGTNRIATEKC
jgi:hypothetical protein